MTTTDIPYRSPLVRAWNTLGRVTGAGRRPLIPSELLARAERACPRAPEPDAEVIAALEVLTDSINLTGHLHAFGRHYLVEMFSGLLTNRRRLARLWSESPAMLTVEVRQPLIILGLPRSGTSFLFNLLARDPAHRYLTNWETTVSQIPPVPRPRRAVDDPRRRAGRFLMGLQRHLAPELDTIHEFHLDGPEECTPLLMQGFATQALAGMFNVPAYSRWLDGASHTATYRHHKRILQTLQSCYPASRWLLKSPDHLAALDALLDVYPDACLVQLHRDPVQSVSSWASLNAAFRGICTDSIDSAELGEQILQRLATDMEAGVRARERLPADRFLDLDYRELVSDPMDSVKRIYEHFGLPLAPQAQTGMQSFLQADRKKSRSHRYAPEDFGLSAERIRAHFANYMQRFAITPTR